MTSAAGLNKGSGANLTTSKLVSGSWAGVGGGLTPFVAPVATVLGRGLFVTDSALAMVPVFGPSVATTSFGGGEVCIGSGEGILGGAFVVACVTVLVITGAGGGALAISS